MSSVIVTWRGRCPEAQTRSRLLAHLRKLADASDNYLRGETPRRPAVSAMLSEARATGLRPRSNIEIVDRPVEGQILISNQVASDARAFDDMARGANLRIIDAPEGEGTLTMIDKAHLRGIDFKLFDPRGLYPGADRLSFVFLECAALPFLDGKLVQVYDRDACAAHPAAVIRSATCVLAPPTVHLRYYLEDWTDLLFAWLKFFFIGDLWWQRREEMQGYAEYRGILLNLQNELGPDAAETASFEALLATFASHADDWQAQLANWAREETNAE